MDKIEKKIDMNNEATDSIQHLCLCKKIMIYMKCKNVLIKLKSLEIVHLYM